MIETEAGVTLANKVTIADLEGYFEPGEVDELIKQIEVEARIETLVCPNCGSINDVLSR
jgi:hypothetical protein